MNDDMTSFVVRFVREGTEEHPARWRGIINHVQTNAKRNFTRLAEVIQFMQEQMGKESVEEFAKFDPELVAQNAQVWGELSLKYQEMMLQTWGQAFGSPTRIQQMIVKGLESLQLPDRTEQQAAVKALELLQSRLAELSKQVQELEQSLAQVATESAH